MALTSDYLQFQRRRQYAVEPLFSVLCSLSNSAITNDLE